MNCLILTSALLGICVSAIAGYGLAWSHAVSSVKASYLADGLNHEASERYATRRLRGNSSGRRCDA